MRKSEVKRKSHRKPFRDVSNRLTAPTKSTAKKKAPESQADLPQDDAIDRLQLIHSDISNILRQIDERIVQAIQAKETNSHQRKEIVSFTNVLSGIHSSLKPWVPRFQEAFPALPTEYKDQPAQASTSTQTLPVQDDGDDDIAARSPEPTKLDLLVSPSPLVSWRAADCTVEWGKQLFALTPLPKPKSAITKSQPLSKSVALERFAATTTTTTTTSGYPSRFTVVFEPKNDNLDKLIRKSTTLENLTPADSGRFKEQQPSTKEFSSPAKSAKGDCNSTTFFQTPCLKASPPKSCILLEPNQENRNFCRFRKSTPFPCGNLKMDDELPDDSETSSGSELSKDPGLKFTNLLGIKPAFELGTTRKDVYASPAWFRSPPRTCTLMDPTEEKSLKVVDPLNFGRLEEFAGSVKYKNDPAALPRENLVLQSSRQPSAKPINKSGLVLNTPAWKEPCSTARRSRPAGENTLKKELWMKFEAASMGGCGLKLPVLEEEEAGQSKGFLDRLEEEAL